MSKQTLQVSRHFLLNGLNCAISLCRKSPEDAAKLLIALSECLLYSTNIKRESISVYKEIDYIKSYLVVQKYRFDERLTVVYEIDEGLTMALKPLTLAMIVENIFVHVLKYKKTGVRIKIQLKMEDSGAVLRISDDGGMMPQKIIEAINHGDGTTTTSIIQLKQDLQTLLGISLTYEVIQDKVTCTVLK